MMALAAATTATVAATPEVMIVVMPHSHMGCWEKVGEGGGGAMQLCGPLAR